jgi:hypothetical protein
MATTINDRASRSALDQGDTYLHVAIACAVVAFLGFAPTFWMPMATGSLNLRPVIYLHGFVFFAWSLFIVFQAWLASRRQLVSHQSWGLVGVSLATAMTILGVLATIAQTQAAMALGMAEAGRAFAIVPIFAILFFAVTFAFAVANVRRPEWHKRLMLVAAISILDAPIARWFIVFLAPPGQIGPPPVGVDIGPSLVSLLLLAYPMVMDWRTRGRPHQAYVIFASIFVAMKILQVPLSTTPAWQAMAAGLASLAS